MGYTTEFEGGFNIDKQLHPKLAEFINKLADTRRMARNVPEDIYGIEGEFYIPKEGFRGQNRESNIIDYSRSPKTQPGLWLQWIYDKESNSIVFDGNEKFYEYIAWIDYLIRKILAPNGYKVNGEVIWQGEDMSDRGKIMVKNNIVTTKELE